jgi:hypothetical protein
MTATAPLREQLSEALIRGYMGLLSLIPDGIKFFIGDSYSFSFSLLSPWSSGLWDKWFKRKRHLVGGIA